MTPDPARAASAHEEAIAAASAAYDRAERRADELTRAQRVEAAVRAYLGAMQAAGYKLVPRDLTDEQAARGYTSNLQTPGGTIPGYRDIWRHIWNGIEDGHDAAPAAPGEEGR